MALEDVFRDTSTSLAVLEETQKLLAKQTEKLKQLTTPELWELHTSYPPQSLIGQAVLKVLQEREPERINMKNIS